MFSKPLLGTDISKVKMTWFEYIWHSCLIQGWYNCWYAFKNWADLMGNNYEGYALLKNDDPLEQCILYFWDSLEDEIYSKDFLDSLLQMSHDVATGKVETVPLHWDTMKRLTDLIDLEEDNEDDE
jgi:hypothetical protein